MLLIKIKTNFNLTKEPKMPRLKFIISCVLNNLYLFDKQFEFFSVHYERSILILKKV